MIMIIVSDNVRSEIIAMVKLMKIVLMKIPRSLKTALN